MVEKLIEIRFLVPPILTVFFVSLFSPDDFSELVSERALPLLLAEGAVVILAVGFLISSLIDRLLDDAGFKLSASTELETWRAIDAEKSAHIHDQIHKRWHMAMANFNAAGGILLGSLVPLFLGFHAERDYLFGYYAVVAILLYILWKNGMKAGQSAKKFGELLRKDSLEGK